MKIPNRSSRRESAPISREMRWSRLTPKAFGAATRAVRRDSAFTMIEIALCLAIVAFALVAIVGVLPAGLNVQKDNREETIINQDSTVWMDAIRSGSFGYDELTNFVDRIVIERHAFDANTNYLGMTTTVGEQGPQSKGTSNVLLTNGARIVGLLSTPKIWRDPSGVGPFTSNHVYAYVRALNGSASDKPPQGNLDIRDSSFGYRMVVDVTPAGSFDPENINTNRSDLVLRRNLSDVRLLCRWPLKKAFDTSLPLDQPLVGNNRLTFRTQAGGWVAQGSYADAPGVPFFFILSGQYLP